MPDAERPLTDDEIAELVFQATAQGIREALLTAPDTPAEVVDSLSAMADRLSTSEGVARPLASLDVDGEPDA